MTLTMVAGPDLTAQNLHEVWRIRDAVFSVEQNCRELDVDDVDLRADCQHVWIADATGQLRSYARIFADGEVLRIGRVATRVSDRGHGLAGRIMTHILDQFGAGELTLHAQAHLSDWYETFGFVISGPGFVEAGIDHVPMARPTA